MRDIIVMLDNVYSEIIDRTADSEEREKILSKIDDVQYLIEDLEFFKR
jgi:hypothetical protein